MSSVFLNTVERTRNVTKKYRGQFCYVIKILFHLTILTPRFADVILVWAETIKLFSFYLTCIFGLFSLVITFQKITAEIRFQASLNLYIISRWALQVHVAKDNSILRDAQNYHSSFAISFLAWWQNCNLNINLMNVRMCNSSEFYFCSQIPFVFLNAT